MTSPPMARHAEQKVRGPAPQEAADIRVQPVEAHCPQGREPPFCDGKRTARPYTRAIERRFTVGNADREFA